jgi:hypothetical protein
MRSKPARQARAATAPACFLTHATRRRQRKKRNTIMSRMRQESPGILKVFNFRDDVPKVLQTEA